MPGNISKLMFSQGLESDCTNVHGKLERRCFGLPRYSGKENMEK